MKATPGWRAVQEKSQPSNGGICSVASWHSHVACQWNWLLNRSNGKHFLLHTQDHKSKRKADCTLTQKENAQDTQQPIARLTHPAAAVKGPTGEG